MSLVHASRRLLFASVIVLLAAMPCRAQDSLDSVTVRLTKVRGAVYMADGVGGFGGGNVAASIGPDGILLVDDMFAAMVPKLRHALDSVSSLPIRIVVNTHFHGDHIQGDAVLGKTATLIGHENVLARVRRDTVTPFPMITFTTELRVRFNGETIRVVHVPNSHTDGDAVVFFEGAKVLHMGDLFFAGMFPAVYREGGGDLRQLIQTLDHVLAEFPADAKVIPGHGDLATMQDLAAYVTMLKETVAAVDAGIKHHRSADAIAQDPAIRKYAKLGDGGAQTLDQYVGMLVKLLQ